MKFVKVDYIPRRRTLPNQRLQMMIDEFAKSTMNAVKVEYSKDEYATQYTCAAAIRKAIERSNRYSIKVTTKNGEVYIYKEIDESIYTDNPK